MPEESNYSIPDRKTAHPAAVKLLPEEFFWDICDDNSPFGNDDGADTLATLTRYVNSGGSNLINFLDDLFSGWGVANRNLDLTTMDELEAAAKQGDIEMIVSMRDNAIIASAFGQFLIQGKIDHQLKSLAMKAMKRRQLPTSIQLWTDPNERTERLKLMEERLQQIS